MNFMKKNVLNGKEIIDCRRFVSFSGGQITEAIMKKFIKELFNFKEVNKKKLINESFDFSKCGANSVTELFESYLIALDFREVPVIYLNETSPHLEKRYDHCSMRDQFSIDADKNTVDLVIQFNKNLIRLYNYQSNKESLKMREQHRDNLMRSGYFQGLLINQ